MRNDGTNLQVLGQTFTVTEPVRLSALTLQAYVNFNVGSADSNQYYLWIGKYANGAPVDASYRTHLYQQVDMRGVACSTGKYYTIDFEDTVLPVGSYAFQLKWKAQVSANNSYWARANGAGAYAGGDRIHILTAAGSSLNFPFSQVEGTGTDLVFALHGTVDFYGGWIAENRLDRAPANPYLNGLTTDGLKSNSVFYSKYSTSSWTVSDGVLRNSSTSDNKIAEGAIARLIDLRSLQGSDDAQLSLSFDYTTGDAREVLYVHLWGYKETGDIGNLDLINLGASDGNAWAPSTVGLDVYNLAKLDGVFTGTPGASSDAASILTSLTGPQSYSDTFDLSGFTTAPDTVSGYDYLVLAFARKINGATTPEVSITNIQLSTDGGSTLHAFPPSNLNPSSVDADPDRDGYSNLFEYALGGNPNLDGDIGTLPEMNTAVDGIDFVYKRRHGAAGLGLSYRIETTPSLHSIPWGSSDLVETDVAPIDTEFEAVTNRVTTTGKNSEFIRLVVEEL